MAPLIAALIKGGLGVLANAVIAKGKDVIQDKLGVDIESALGTEEGKLELKQLEFKHEEFLIEAAAKKAEQDNLNTANARDMNTEIQKSQYSSSIAKEAAYYLDFLIIAATLGIAYIIFLSEDKLVNQELAYTAFGALLTMCGTILNFHRGTSSSSRNKDDTIKALSQD